MGLSDRVSADDDDVGRKADNNPDEGPQGAGNSSSTGVFRAQTRASLAPAAARDTWTRRVSAHPRKLLAPNTLSRRFWGLNWSNHLPRVFGRRGETIDVGDWNRVSDFIGRMQPELRETNHHARPRPAQASKQRYFQEECDLLEIRDAHQLIGVFIGAPEDWSTYYCRLIAFDPAHSKRHAIRGFAKEALFPILAQAGVERLVGETNPTNLIMQRLFNDLGFHPTGQHLTDRWGTLIRFTKFLSDDAASSFSSRYAPGA